MNELTINRLLAAMLAVVVALRADIGTVPLEGEALAWVTWVLTGAAAGLAVFLGPQIADAVKAALRGSATIPPPP